MVVSPPSDFRHPGKPENFDKSPEAYQHASQHSNGGRRRNATLLTNIVQLQPLPQLNYQLNSLEAHYLLA